MCRELDVHVELVIAGFPWHWHLAELPFSLLFPVAPHFSGVDVEEEAYRTALTAEIDLIVDLVWNHSVWRLAFQFFEYLLS